MIQTFQKRRGGFTLVEIMIVVAIIALLASIAVPNFLRARKRSQATRIKEDVRIIESAIDQYAIEYNKQPNATVPWEAIRMYLKEGSPLYNGVDVFGGTALKVSGTVDSIPSIPSSLVTGKLDDVVDADFWTPYKVQ